MRKLIVALLTVSLALPLLAEGGDSFGLPSSASREPPQLAFRLFSTWADNYEANAKRGKAIGEGLLFGLGAAGAAGAAVTWFAGDELSMQSVGAPMDAELKSGLALGFGISSAALLGSGVIVALAPIKDYRAIYADVFDEKDPEVREAMAVSVLRYQSDRGRQSRIRSSLMGIIAPLVAAAIVAGVDADSPEDYGHRMLGNCANYSWWMVGSAVGLFVKSDEERLYQRYLDARDAYYGARK